MRVLVTETVYEMDKPEFDKVLEVASKQVPCGIYAIVKDDYCELKNHRFKSLAALDKKILGYEKQGFTVLYNKGN